MGIYALRVNKRMCTAPCHKKTAEFLSLYVLFNVQRLLVGGTISNLGLTRMRGKAQPDGRLAIELIETLVRLLLIPTRATPLFD